MLGWLRDRRPGSLVWSAPANVCDDGLAMTIYAVIDVMLVTC